MKVSNSFFVNEASVACKYAGVEKFFVVVPIQNLVRVTESRQCATGTRDGRISDSDTVDLARPV